MRGIGNRRSLVSFLTHAPHLIVVVDHEEASVTPVPSLVKLGTEKGGKIKTDQ